MSPRILIVIDKSIDPAQGHGVTSWALDLKAEFLRQNIWCEIAGYYTTTSAFDISGAKQAETNCKLLKIVQAEDISTIISATSKTAFACWDKLPAHILKLATIHGAKPSIVKRELLAKDRVDAYVGVSEPVTALAKSLKPKRPVFCINNGIAALLSPQGVERKGETVLWIGRLQMEQKRAHWLRHIAPLVETAGLELHIVGKGPAKAWLQKKLHNHKVRWSENLTRTQLAEELAQAKAVLFTSSYEGLSIAMLEAIQAGCLIIAPDLENTKAGVLSTDNSLLYRSSATNYWSKASIKSLQTVLAKLKSADNNYLVQNARTTINDSCNLEKTAQAYAQLIEQLSSARIGQTQGSAPTNTSDIGTSTPLSDRLSAIRNFHYQRYGLVERNYQKIVDWIYSHA